MNFDYVILRLIRHFMPERLVGSLLRRGWIIKPASETRNVKFAVDRYLAPLAERGFQLGGKRVLVLGYGGRFEIANELLERGAAHVVLVDQFARTDESYNRRAFSANSRFVQVAGKLRPRPELATVLTEDIRRISIAPADLILSNSVFEHLDDVEGIVRALAKLTALAGVHVHVIDLRDHFFKYPFEMLRFGPWVWRHLLNPSSNHNRLRLWDHRKIFLEYFNSISVEVIERLDTQFNRASRYIRPEFKSGTPDDAVSQVRVVLAEPVALR